MSEFTGAIAAATFAQKKADRAKDIQVEVNAAKQGYKYRLKIKINRGIDLLDVEDVSHSDPFVTVYTGVETRRTRMVVNDLNPIWNEEFDIMLRGRVEYVRFLVQDMEGIGEPVPMGWCSQHLEGLLNEGHKFYQRKLRMDDNDKSDQCGQLEFEIDYHALPPVEDRQRILNYPRHPGREICKHWEDEKECPHYDKHAKCVFDHPPHEEIPMIRKNATRKNVTAKFGASMSQLKVQTMLKTLTSDLAQAENNRKPRTRLHTAALLGDVETALACLDDPDIGVDDTDPEDGWTALHMACKTGHEEIAAILIERNADINVEDMKGWTPLHRVAGKSAGHTDIAELLLAQRGVKHSVNDEEDGTPLHLACQFGHGEIAALLTDAGAEVTIADARGWTPLHWASYNGKLACALAVLENATSQPDVDALDKQGQTPLHLACLRGHAGVAALLLENGASANRATLNGTMPLHRAAMGGHPHIIEALIQGGAEVDALDGADMTALHRSAAHGKASCAEGLIHAKADVWLKCTSGERPIALAEINGFNNTAAIIELAMGDNKEIRIGVRQPAAGAEWIWGDEHQILWEGNGHSSYCKIEVYHKAEPIHSIAERAANDGSFDWEIPISLEPGGGYQIKVTSMVNSKTYGFSDEFIIKDRTDVELKELTSIKQRKDINYHVEKFDRDFRKQAAEDAGDDGEMSKVDGGLLILTLGRPSFGIGKNKLNAVMMEKPDLVSESKLAGQEELSQEDTVNLLLACAEQDPIFFKSLHRRLPRMAKKMHETYHTYVKKRNMLQTVFNAIDADKGGKIDQTEMQQFFGITGGSGRALKYSEAQLALMTEEDKELLLSTDDLTTSMDFSGDGVLEFSEFMRFFLGNNPDGSAEDLEANLQDLGYLEDGQPRRFSVPTVQAIEPAEANPVAVVPAEANPVELLDEQQKDLFAQMCAGAQAAELPNPTGGDDS